MKLRTVSREEQWREAEATVGAARCELRRNQLMNEHLLAAVAAAILGAQGSPVWSRTAEALLLAHPEVKRVFRLAAREVDAAVGPS